MFYKTIAAHWIIVAITSVAVITNIIWIALDTSPPLWDIAGHSYRAAHFADLLMHGQLLQLLSFDTIYPPGQYLVTALGFIVFGFQEDIPQYSLLLWLVVYCVSLYSIGLQLFAKRGFACLAVAVSLGFPLLAHFSRIYDLDFPQTAAVTAALAALLYSQQFQRRGWTSSFAALVAAAILIKWTAIIFLLGPVCLVLWQAISRPGERKSSLTNIGIGLGIGLALLLPWYAQHLSTIYLSQQQTRANQFSVPYDQLLSLQNSWFYIRQSIAGISWPVAVSVVSGLTVLLWQRRWSAPRLLVLVWVIVPYIVLTFGLYSKESRYIISSFPALALLAVVPIAALQRTTWRLLASAALLLCVTLPWADTSWGIRNLPQSVYSALQFESTYGYKSIKPKKPRYGFTYPTHYQPETKLIGDAIFSDLTMHLSLIEDGQLRLAVVPNSIFLTAQQIQYYAILSGLDRFTNPFTVDYSLSTQIRDGSDWPAELIQADYIITKTGDQGPVVWGPQVAKIAVAEQRQTAVYPFTDFTLVTSWQTKGIEASPTIIRLYRNER